MGDIRILFDDVEGRVAEVIDYTVTEDASPIIAGDSSGGVGQISVATRAVTEGPVKDRTPAVVGKNITLIDENGIDDTAMKGRGTIGGLLTKASQPGARLNLTAETVLSRFNVDRVAKPFYGVLQPQNTTTTDRINLMTNPSLETATTGYTLVNATGGTWAATRPTDSTAYEGSYYYRQTFTGTATVAGAGAYWQFNIPETGVSYTASGYYRVTRAAIGVVEGVPSQRVSIALR